MQPQSEISILDWLKENTRDIGKILRTALQKPARMPTPPLTEALAAQTDPAAVVPPPVFNLETTHTEILQSGQPADTQGRARVKIDAEIPLGATLTITISADQEGVVSVEKRTLGGSRPKSTQTRPAPLWPPEAWKRINALLPKQAFLKLLSRSKTFFENLPLVQNGLLISVLAIIAAAIADGRLRQAQAFTETAVLPLLLGGLLFAGATWALHTKTGLLNDAPSPESAGLSGEKKRRNIALGLFATALLLVFWIAQDSANAQELNAAWALLRWGIAIGLVCVAAWRIQEVSDLPKSEQNKNKKWLLVGLAAIVLLAFALRIWQLSSIPYTLGGDEGEQGVEILQILDDRTSNPFITGWYGVPTLSFFVNAVTVAWFGNTLFGLRLSWVLVGTASVLVSYLLVKELKGTRLALITAALVATYHYHIHYSRLGSNQISDTLLVGLTLLFVMRGYTRGRWLDWALAGIIAGIGQYFYAGGRLAVVLALFLAAYLWVRDGFKITRSNRIGLEIFVIGLLVAGGPMFAYASHFPDSYNSRSNQIGILQNGWLVREAILLGKTQSQVLLDQFWRAALAFNAYPDRVVWYGLDGPLLDKLSGILFLLGGFSASLWSLRDRRLAPLVAWWWAAILTGGMLTDTTPSSQRLITASIPAMFFVAWAIEQISAALSQYFPKRVGLSVSVLIVLLISALSLNLYFNEYTPKRIYGGPYAMIATLLSEQVHQNLGPDWQIYFFGAPEMYIDIGTARYLMPEIAKIDILTPLSAPFTLDDALPGGQNLLFVFRPDRANELEWVRQTFPAGQTAETRSPLNPDEILYITYSVERRAAP